MDVGERDRDARESVMEDWAARAERVLPHGVASAARLRTVPLVLDSAHGAEVVDTDGRRYIDFVLAMGPMLLGHGRGEVSEAVHRQVDRGVLFGTHPPEIQLAERLVGILPFADRIVFANSGSEATHWAIRIARATTGRPIIVKFEGHYHGWIDPLFCNTQVVAPAARELPHPPVANATGMAAPADILICRWNDLDELRSLFEAHPDQIAGVIMEPLPMNFGTMLPGEGYLEGVRDMCDELGALLIFDEVLSGFRVALGGAAELMGVQPDLGVYAKAIAAGHPLAVVAGSEAALASITRGELMPAGTYSGGPIAIAAAHATLDVLIDGGDELYSQLEARTTRLREALNDGAARRDMPLAVQQIGSVIQLLWAPTLPVRSYADAMAGEHEIIRRACEAVQAEGYYLSPRGLILLCTEHTDAMVEGLADALLGAFDRCWPAHTET